MPRPRAPSTRCGRKRSSRRRSLSTADGWVWQQQANARAYEEAQQAELRAPECAPKALDEVTGMYGKTYVAKHDNLAALLMGVKQQDPAYDSAVDAAGGPG